MTMAWAPLAMLCAAATAQQTPPAAYAAVSTSTAKPPPLRLLSAEDLPGFEDTLGSRRGLARAARKGIHYLSTVPNHPVQIGGREYAPGMLMETLEEFLAALDANPSAESLEQAIREKFDVFQSVGLDGTGRVVFSSYYQPTLEASLKKHGLYRYPIYRRPPDMVELDLGDFDRKSAGETLVGRVDKESRFVPYFSRDAIDVHKTLAGKGHELAWLKDKFDVLDLHIQGSGILRLPNGRELLAQFAATNARPYRSVAAALVKAGIFGREEITHSKMRAYFREHPEAADWALSQNPRYTFFKLEPLSKEREPLGTTLESLVPARSIAIDPAIVPLGALVFFTTVSPQADENGRVLGQFPNGRFTVALDTGGAIKGPGRVDIYAGHGPQAAATARGQWHDGKFYILVKKVPPRDR